MRTVVLGERPPELEQLIVRRRALGLDARDEVWEGELHVAPYADGVHSVLEAQLTFVLTLMARRKGLVVSGSFNLGQPDDYRIPDGGLHSEVPRGVHHATAALVVEVLSPDDETFQKFGFYAAHGVDEVLVADPAERSVRLWQLRGASYEETGTSDLLETTAAALTEEIAWP